MKKRFTNIRLLLITSFLLLGSAACTKENLDDCPARVVVVAHPEILETYPQRYVIESLTLYIFDSDGRFVEQHQSGAYTHGGSYVFDLDLDPGEYTFLAWTNMGGDCYTTSHTREQCESEFPNLTEMSAWLQVAQDKRIMEDICELHYGCLSGAVVEYGVTDEYVVELIPDTYRINYTVTGMPVSGDTFGFTVTDDNSHYGFDNSILPDKDDFQHIRHSTFEEGNLYATMLSLKLDHDRTPWFCFSRTVSDEEQELYARDLVKMIQRAYELNGQTLDFSKIFEFDIEISFNATLDEFIIKINGWDVKTQPGILD